MFEPEMAPLMAIRALGPSYAFALAVANVFFTIW